MKKVGIIGAGLSSLYSACFLAKEGYEVEVFEKNSMAGGRSQFFKKDGFTFDMGPSWYWMPELVDGLFEDLGEKRSDYFNLTRLDPAYQVLWKDRTATQIPASKEELLKLFDSFETNGGDKLLSFLKDAQTKYEIATESFLENPGLKIGEIAKLSVLKNALKLDVFKSVEKDVSKRFTSEKARSILNFPVLFLGEMPGNIPSLYTLMNYADLELGTWYPDGGMHALAAALEKIALKEGVKFHFNVPIEEVAIEDGRANGLRTKEGTHAFDAIVGGADYNHIEQNLIPERYRRYSPEYWDKRKMAPSSLIFYLGINKEIPGLDHHNLFFDEDLIDHGKEIYDNPKWPTKPLFYACAPSKTDKKVAPEGQENIFILMPLAPNLEDSDETRETYFDTIIDRMEDRCGTSIRENIVYKRSFCVSDFKSEYNSFKGNAYGLANTLFQTANLKPK
ncbi:MAG: phytoene desaturase family protein, partial [Crocinitomicaceae bacterium]